MSKLASSDEIKKAVPFIENISWLIQNDKQDSDTSFIYHCQRLDQVIDLALSNDVNLGYAVHRWYNFQCSKSVEKIFCWYGAEPYEDEKDHDVDLTINGIPFDIKLSTVSIKYEEDLDLTQREDKDKYIKWLIDNASQESRKHTKNKIFVICDTLADKCNFERISDKILSFLDYFIRNIEKYKQKEVICELIYVKSEEKS